MAAPRVRRVRADNPGPMTLSGTNTYVLAEPGSTRAVVVDPGPALPEHLAAVLDTVEQSGQQVAMVLLTHGHADHSEAAPELARRTGAPVRAVDPEHRLGSEGLVDGDTLDVDGLVITLVATPGHTSDSVSLLLPAESVVLTGDHVLGHGTTVVAHPDGRLEPYLTSLSRLQRLCEQQEVARLLPGHGPELTDPLATLAHYRSHRRERLSQVRAAVEAGARTPQEVVEAVYAEVDRVLWPAAELSVRAQLDYLTERGEIPR